MNITRTLTTVLTIFWIVFWVVVAIANFRKGQLKAQQVLTMDCNPNGVGGQTCVSRVPLAAEKHASLMWVEQLGVHQKVYKVNIDGTCWLVFETAMSYSVEPRALSVSTQPTRCE